MGHHKLIMFDIYKQELKKDYIFERRYRIHRRLVKEGILINDKVSIIELMKYMVPKFIYHSIDEVDDFVSYCIIDSRPHCHLAMIFERLYNNYYSELPIDKKVYLQFLNYYGFGDQTQIFTKLKPNENLTDIDKLRIEFKKNFETLTYNQADYQFRLEQQHVSIDENECRAECQEKINELIQQGLKAKTIEEKNEIFKQIDDVQKKLDERDFYEEYLEVISRYQRSLLQRSTNLHIIKGRFKYQIVTELNVPVNCIDIEDACHDNWWYYLPYINKNVMVTIKDLTDNCWTNAKDDEFIV
jgi:hypothetical protein